MALPYALSLAKENNARLYILHVSEEQTAATDRDALKNRLSGLIPEEVKLMNQPKVFVEHGRPGETAFLKSQKMAMD